MKSHPMLSKKIAPISKTAQNIPCAERLRKSLNSALMDVSDIQVFSLKKNYHLSIYFKIILLIID